MAADGCRIPLTRGFFALVSPEDFECVAAFKWQSWFRKSKPSEVYATRTFKKNGKHGRIWMHRFIVGAESGEFVDHRNGNGLDNRRGNLRRCTNQENQRNVVRSPRQKRGGFKGVRPSNGRWAAYIRAGKRGNDGKSKTLHLGTFDEQVDAARAYDAAALKYFGEFASLNFPDKESDRRRVAG